MSRLRGLVRLIAVGGRLAARDPAAAALAMRLAFWVAAVTLLARTLPLPRALGLASRPPRGVPPADPLPVACRLAHRLDVLLRLDCPPFTPRCWKRAAVLHRFLAGHGIATQVVFGVRTSGQIPSGHAWLESRGRPYLERDEAAASRYRRLYVFPPHGG